MPSKSAVMDLLKGGYPENISAAIKWTGSTVIFGLLPMLLSLLGFLIVNKPQEILVLLTNGEVLMVSNTIVCSAAILLGKDRSPTGKYFGRVPYIQFATIIVAATSFNYGVIRTLVVGIPCCVMRLWNGSPTSVFNRFTSLALIDPMRSLGISEPHLSSPPGHPADVWVQTFAHD